MLSAASLRRSHGPIHDHQQYSSAAIKGVAVISPRYELEKYKKLINGLATAEQPF